jgi:hypothetical protein
MKDSLVRSVILNLLWVSICLIIIFFGHKLPIEFSSNTVSSIAFLVMCLGLLGSIIWTGYKVFQIESCAFTGCISIISLPIIFFALFGMCGNSDELLYKNRANSTTIVARTFGCGAWDSDPPIYTYYKKTPFLGIFYLKTKVDTSRLDKSIWLRQ